MLKKYLFLLLITLFQLASAFDSQVKSWSKLGPNVTYAIYDASDFPLSAHVIKLPQDTIDTKLIPARGQREEVSSIAKRNNAFIAINGSNYRRGGKYNGNRLNLLYLNKQVLADLQFIRGSFGWSSKTKSAILDTIFLETELIINNQPLPIDHINQPRAPGQSALYTELADISLLHHTHGKNILINDRGIVQEIKQEVPNAIPHHWYVYQVDKDRLNNIERGMEVEISFKLKSFSSTRTYDGYDFILGGAGLLIHKGKIVTNQLYNEFSQGNAIVHCNDEIAADFHTKKMQQWLIEQRHPRTAIGITNTNEICIVVADGRQKSSEGLTLKELALFMHQLGCISALNIGGGGCSTLYIADEARSGLKAGVSSEIRHSNPAFAKASAGSPIHPRDKSLSILATENKVVNNPSTKTERPVSEALCFFPSKL